MWVQLVHGMNEHMGRYEEFAAYLAGAWDRSHGGHDCIGHGKTAASLEGSGLVWREAGTSVSGTGYPEKWRFMEKEYFRKRNM